jgi:hypothetical protein
MTWAQDVRPEQTLEVLVTTAPGAPTADDLVDYYRGAQLTPPPLQGLTVGNPQKIAYLVPVRAEGDFLAHLEAHPDSVRAQLERYVVVIYPAGEDLAAPLAALRADPCVLAASPPLPTEFSTPLAEAPPWATASLEAPTDSQYGRTAMNVDAAWQLAGGYALIADIDSGLYPESVPLRQFDAAGHYVGGGFAPVQSMDISLAGHVDPPQNSYDVDERRAMPVTNPSCNPDPQNHPNMQPTIAGHGTHVAGLIGANRSAALGVQGICNHCSIAMWKTAYAACNIENGAGTVKLQSNFAAQVAALTLTGDVGAAIANMSLGSPSHLPPTFCTTQSSEAMCKAIAMRGIATSRSLPLRATAARHSTFRPRIRASFQQAGFRRTSRSGTCARTAQHRLSARNALPIELSIRSTARSRNWSAPRNRCCRRRIRVTTGTRFSSAATAFRVRASAMAPAGAPAPRCRRRRSQESSGFSAP